MKFFVIFIMTVIIFACSNKAEFVLVEKSKRKMYLFKKNKIIKQYDVSLGKNSRGAKVFQGDGKTPEGWYYIDNKNPESRFHKSLHLSYPNNYDLYRAAVLGKNPGKDIVIHALPNHMEEKMEIMSKSGYDWTNGCIAVDNNEIKQIWDLVKIGTPVLIKP